MDNNAALDKAAINDNISRTVDKTALRKVRNLVDNFERDERSAKSRQFKVMLLTIVVFAAVAMPLSYFSGYSKAGSDRRAAMNAANTDCMSRDVARQRSALEEELRAATPKLSGDELGRRLDSFNDMFITSARKHCGNVMIRSSK